MQLCMSNLEHVHTSCLWGSISSIGGEKDRSPSHHHEKVREEREEERRGWIGGGGGGV